MTISSIAAILVSLATVLSGLSNTLNTLSNTSSVSQVAEVSSSMGMTAIVNPLSITNKLPLPSGSVGQQYSALIEGTGGTGAYNWAVALTSSLPPGLSLSNPASKCLGCQSPVYVTGTPTTAGTYTFGIRLNTTTIGEVAEKTFTIVVSSGVNPLSITTASPLATGTVGTLYGDSISATGGNDSYVWSISAGALPPGVSLIQGACFVSPCQIPASLSGTPTTPGTYMFTVQVYSAANKVNMIEKQFTIAINPTSSSSWYDPTFVSASADSVGVTIYAKYPNCPSASVLADVWLVNQPDGVNKFQDRVYLSSTVSGNPIGYAYFKQPVPSGTPGGNVLINLWSIKSDCSTYAAIGGTTVPSPKSFFLSQPVQVSQFYGALTQNRLIKLDTPTLTAKFDRSTGATYELYNKRSIPGSLHDPAPSNALHSNMGAVLQVAFHDQIDAALKKSQGVVACGGAQGYWNPTQAGSYCSYINGVEDQTPVVPTGANLPQVACDGVNNPNCSVATKSISFSDFSMLNWDYYSGYIGPLNPQDLLHLSENVTANDAFIEYDIKVNNLGVDRRGFLELPTFYFTNNYRRYYFQDPNLSVGSPVTQVDIPLQKQIGSNYSSTTHDEINWVSFENTSAIKNDVYTIAWFYDDNYKNSIVPYPGGNGVKFNGYAIQTQSVSGGIKFVNYPVIILKANQLYNLKYVIFPYRYNEVITSRFGTKTVADTIADIRAEFNAKNNSDLVSNTNTNTNTNTNINTTTTTIHTSTNKTVVFDKNLYYGMAGNSNVLLLQQLMTSEGVYSGEINGNFYSKTYAGVKAFQTKYGINSTGYVGPITRVKLNQIYNSTH